MQKRSFEQNGYTTESAQESECLRLSSLLFGAASEESARLLPASLELTSASLAKLVNFERLPFHILALLEQQRQQQQVDLAVAAQEILLRQRQENDIFNYNQQHQVHERLQQSTLVRHNTSSLLEQAMKQRIGAERTLSTALAARDEDFGRPNRSVSRSNESRLNQEHPSKDENQRDGGKRASSPVLEDNVDPSLHSTDANEKFPLKLYRMLEDAESCGDDNIVSFLSDGKAFLIHKLDEFVSKIMPKYFNATRVASFQRQLNLYGFRRITEGKNRGGYFHELFMKGRKGLCTKIRRKKAIVKVSPVVVCAPVTMRNDFSLNDTLNPAMFGGLEAPYASGLQRLAAILKETAYGRGRQW